MKLLRTIQLDASDTFIFENAAAPGEWAVSGAFAFWNADPAKLEGKARSAFRGGFLGVNSFGRSTLAQIVDATEAERADLLEVLAQRLVDGYGAPDIKAARTAALDEVKFVESLCSQPQGTLIAVHRSSEDGAIRKSFRTLRPRDGQKPARAFSFMDVESEDDQLADDAVDLIAIAGRERT